MYQEIPQIPDGTRFAGWSEDGNVHTVVEPHRALPNEYWCEGDESSGLWLYNGRYILENLKD